MGCQHLEELPELYLLGALSEAAGTELAEHLARGCPHCQERLREAALVTYVLSLNTRPVRPSPKLRARVLGHQH